MKKSKGRIMVEQAVSFYLVEKRRKPIKIAENTSPQMFSTLAFAFVSLTSISFFFW